MPGDDTREQPFSEDLDLARDCAQGLPAALSAFEQRYLLPLRGFLLRAAGDTTLVDEALQVLRDKLLVSRDGASPKIASYAGRGSLLSWTRTAAVHTLRGLQRQRHAVLRYGGDVAVQLLAPGQDPELDFIKGRYRDEFKLAFQQALAALPLEQRHVVRLHYLDGLNIDKIGALLHVHRATVARWRTEAKEAILHEMRRLLRQRLDVSSTEFDSLVGLMQSQLEVSIARLLEAARDPGE